MVEKYRSVKKSFGYCSSSMEDKEWEFFVTIADEHPANGEWVQSERLVIIKNREDHTIWHEAAHAAFEMFRSIGLSFDMIFDTSESHLGEEMVINAIEQIALLIKEGIKELESA